MQRMPCLPRRLDVLLVTLLITAEGVLAQQGRYNARPARYPPISKAPNPPPIVGLPPFTSYQRDIQTHSRQRPLPYYTTTRPVHAPLDIPLNPPPWSLKPRATRFEPSVPRRPINPRLRGGFLHSGPARYLPAIPANIPNAVGRYPEYHPIPGARGAQQLLHEYNPNTLSNTPPQAIGFATPHPRGVIPPPPIEWYPRQQQPLQEPIHNSMNTKLPKPPKPLTPSEFGFGPRHPKQPHLNPPPIRNAIVDSIWARKPLHRPIAATSAPTTPELIPYHRPYLTSAGGFQEQRGFIPQAGVGYGPSPYIGQRGPQPEPRGQIPYEQIPAHMTPEYSIYGGMPYNPPVGMPPSSYNEPHGMAPPPYNHQSREPPPAQAEYFRPRVKPGSLYPEFREVIPTGTAPTPVKPTKNTQVRPPPRLPPPHSPSGLPPRQRIIPRLPSAEGETLCGPSLITTPPPMATFAPYHGPLAVGERRMGQYGGSFYTSAAVAGQSMANAAKPMSAGVSIGPTGPGGRRRGRFRPTRPPPPIPICYCDTASDCNPGPAQELGRNYTLDHCYDMYGLDPHQFICCCHG